MFSSRAERNTVSTATTAPGGADGVAAPGGPRRTEALEREDEADRGDEVEQRGPAPGRGCSCAFLPARRLRRRRRARRRARRASGGRTSPASGR